MYVHHVPYLYFQGLSLFNYFSICTSAKILPSFIEFEKLKVSNTQQLTVNNVTKFQNDALSQESYHYKGRKYK